MSLELNITEWVVIYLYCNNEYKYISWLYSVQQDSLVCILLRSEELKAKYGDRLSKEMSGTEFEVISRVMKGVLNMKITVPGAFKR